MKARYYLLGLLFAAASFGAEPSIEFLGVLAGGRETSVSLSDKSTGQTRWVKVGQAFGGYVVSEYDARTDTVMLTQGGRQFRVRLKAAKVQTGGVEPTPEIKRRILNNLRQLAAAADQFYLENGKTTTTLNDLVGPTKYVKELLSVDGEDYRTLEFAQGKPLKVTTTGGYTTSYEP